MKYILLLLFLLLIPTSCTQYISPDASNNKLEDFFYEELGNKREETAKQNRAVLHNQMNLLDEAYKNYRNIEKEKNVRGCLNQTDQYELILSDLLSDEQLELYSKLDKARKAKSLVDARLYYNKLFETLSFEQSIALKDYEDSFLKCNEITKNYQTSKNDYENQKKKVLYLSRVKFYNDPNLFYKIPKMIDQKYP